jgi:hypothetical protein
MKIRSLLILFVFLSAIRADAQGLFWGVNLNARTRIASVDGPLAGTNIYGQFFAGAVPESLSLVGPIKPHLNGGGFSGGEIVVPNVPPGEYAYVQLLVWDSLLWGTSLANVPSEQFGRTDIVQVFLTRGTPGDDPVFAPPFTQPAIVPVPEPSAVLLAGAMSAIFLLRARKQSRRR